MRKYLDSAIKIFAIIISLVIFLERNGYCVDHGYVFSSDGRYQVLDLRYQIVKEGNIYDETIQKSQEIESTIKGTSIYKIFYSDKLNKIFFLIGQGQANKYYGLLIFQLEPMKFVHFLRKEINLAESPVNLLVYEEGDRFYLSYWESKGESQFKPKTECYDGDTFQIIKEYTDSLFGVNEISCLIGDKLYNGRLFDIRTAKEIKKSGIPLGFATYDCRNGHTLGISSKTIEMPVVLVLADLRTDPIIKKEIRTNEKIAGFSSFNEWYLSKDAKYIIRDELKKEGKTGRLVFIDAKNGRKTELNIPRKSPYGAGIKGFSLSGELLFYESVDKLDVIDIKKQKIIKEFQIPFSPVGVIWP